MTIRYARPESVIFDFDFTLADSSTGTCECVNHAFSRMDLEPVSMVEVYVGDSSTDAETAKAAGIPFMAVLTGTTLREEFEDSGAVGILDDLGQLPGVLD